MMIVNAFKSKKEIFTNVLGLPESLSMENFVDAFIDLNFVNSLFNSLLITGISVTIIIISSSMAGYAVDRNTIKLSGVILLVFVADQLLPFEAGMIAPVSIFGRVGLCNGVGL